MPDRYRKKPVEITAVRWTGDNEAELIAFTEGGFTMLPPAPYPPHLEHLPPPPNTAQVYDKLHHTWVGVENGQWIIRGVKGEFYPCAGDVFAETYEPVTDPADLDDDEAGQLGADAYDLDIKAAALREFADLIDRGPAVPLRPSVYSALAREQAGDAEAEAERLRARIPAPDGGHCQTIDVDGQPVRVQAAPDMPTEVHDALEDVIRTVQRNHGAGRP